MNSRSLIPYLMLICLCSAVLAGTLVYASLALAGAGHGPYVGYSGIPAVGSAILGLVAVATALAALFTAWWQVIRRSLSPSHAAAATGTLLLLIIVTYLYSAWLF